MRKILGWFHLLPVITDTLKRDGRWSMTKIMMAVSYDSALYAFFYDMYKNGFNFQTFCVMLGVGLGAKVTDAYSKKLTPNNTTNTTNVTG